MLFDKSVTNRTKSECASIVFKHSPVIIFLILIFLSNEQLTIFSFEIRTILNTQSEWPSSICKQQPELMLKILIRLAEPIKIFSSKVTLTQNMKLDESRNFFKHRPDAISHTIIDLSLEQLTILSFDYIPNIIFVTIKFSKILRSI